MIPNNMTALIVIVLLLAVSLSLSDGAKILILPCQGGGHLAEAASIGDGLTLRGHDVHMVLNTFMKNRPDLQNRRYKHIFTEAHPQTKEIFGKMIEKAANHESWEMGIAFRPLTKHDCKELLFNEKTMKKIEDMNFDLVIVDRTILCYYLLPHRFGIPYISYGAYIYPHDDGVHPLFTSSSCATTVESTSIWNRINHLRANLLISNIPYSYYDPYDADFLNYTPDKPYSSLNELQSKSELVLLDIDEVLDCPKITLPDYIYVGGVTTRPAAQIKGEIGKFLDEAKDGVIVISFGSVLRTTAKTLETFTKVFESVPKRFLWTTTFSDESLAARKLPSNVLVLPWIPQNDVLGHPNVRLLITHCGQNGQMEALYHGVPMLGFPFHTDQIYNCKRLAIRGVGMEMEYIDFTAEELTKNINIMTGNANYTEHMKKLSAIFRSQPQTPVEKTVYWVEHVLKYGSAHLKSPMRLMQFYEVYMWDILFLILSTLTIVIMLLICCVNTLKVKSPQKKMKSH